MTLAIFDCLTTGLEDALTKVDELQKLAEGTQQAVQLLELRQSGEEARLRERIAIYEEELTIRDAQVERAREEASMAVMRSNQVTEKAEATAAKYKDEMEELRKAVEELSTAAIGNLQTAKLAVEDERDEMRDELAKVMLSLVPGGNSLTGRGSGEGGLEQCQQQM